MLYNEDMKLNGDIIYRGLKQKYNVSISGPCSTELVLGRPQFYMESEDVFASDCLYLATAEHLPHRPQIRRNSVLVCIGENIRMKYYSDRMCLITVHNKADFFRVFQAIQDIYDRYDSWEKELYRYLLNEGDIRSILECSEKIINKPMIVLDASFRIIAVTQEDLLSHWDADNNGFLSSQNLSSFLHESDLMTEKKGAIRLDVNGVKTLNVNLFDQNDQYQGCLCIWQGDADFDAGEERLAEFLAWMLEQAIRKNPQILYNEQSSMKALFRTLLEEQPITPSQRWALNAANRKTEYACVCLEYSGRKNRIPASYICDLFEETFPNSCALITEPDMVCFMENREGTREKLNEFVQSMNLTAGVSEGFSDLYSIRIYYAQALSALGNGQLMKPEEKLYYFSDYALTSLIINSLGDLPAEAYFPKGLKELLEHDSSSGVSYFETLRVFLEENMSFTSAAKRLYVHRSTLIDRIARIERDLQINLDNSDDRLLLEIILKAVETEKLIKQT